MLDVLASGVFVADGVIAEAQDAAARLGLIEQLQTQMLSMPQLEMPVEHTHGPGFYARTIHIPAGATLVGRVHTTEHIFLLSKGSLLVATEDGEQELTAPCQLVCRAGLKRAGHAMTDCVVTNVHITDETDLAELEAMLVEPARQLEFAA
jgi:hypothetical protein